MRNLLPLRVGDGNSLAFEDKLEKFKESEYKLVASLEKNSRLMKDHSKIRDELNHPLKWTDLSNVF